MRLRHSLSIHFGLLLKPWQSSMIATDPATRLSSSTILLHVVFGRPGLLLPSGLYSNAVTQCSSLFFLIVCPIHFQLRRLISSLVLFTPVLSWICWCEMVHGHLILSMRFMHLYWKASSFFASVFVSFQASQPYIKTALTIVPNNWPVVLLLISLLSQILRNL